MNSLFEQAIQYVNQKRELFQELETISEKMLLMEVEELIESVETRGDLLNQIAQQDAELKTLCVQNDAIRQMLNNTRLPQTEQEEELYNSSMQVKAAASRIMESEKTIEEYMQYKRNELKTKIEQLNTSSQSTAKYYHKVIAGGITENSKNFSRNF